MEWRSARRGAHSIFNLPKTGTEPSDVYNEERPPGLASLGESQSHPSYLHMPVLSTTATASFPETWETADGRNNRDNHHHRTRHNNHHPSDTHFPRPYPPHSSGFRRRESKEGEGSAGRSPKIIRFREDYSGDDEDLRSHSRITRHHASRSTSPPAIEISPHETSNSPPKVESRSMEQMNSDKQTLHYDVVQITPNPDYNHAKTSLKHVHFPVSRRGGRGTSRGGGVIRPVPISRHGRNASH